MGEADWSLCRTGLQSWGEKWVGRGGWSKRQVRLRETEVVSDTQGNDDIGISNDNE